MISTVDVGNRIRELRKSYKITQNEFANRLGVTKSAISSYENGSRLPSYDILIKISLIFKVSTDYLLGRIDKKTQTISISGLTDKQIESIKCIVNIYRTFNTLRDRLPESEQQLIDEFIEMGTWSESPTT